MSPLDGIRVIEAASYVSGPFGGMILADLGADVVKVEPPRGDPQRRLGRIHGDSSLLFRATNQNKGSVVLDLKQPDGRARFRLLLSEADVLITNWRPEVASSLGLDDVEMRGEFPQLIWVRVTGFGSDGPMSGLPAYDTVIQARSGAMLSGAEAPLPANSLVADKVVAMFVAQTATAALLARAAAGDGAICDVTMVDAMAYFYGADISSGHRVVDAAPELDVGRMMAGNAPFRTSDSFIVVVPVSGAQIRRCLDAVGLGDRWDGLIAAGPPLWEALAGLIAPVLATRTTAEWEAEFRRADVPATAVLTFADHLADPQIAHNGTYVAVTDPGVGDFLQVRYPAFFDGRRIDPIERRPAPPLPPRS